MAELIGLLIDEGDATQSEDLPSDDDQSDASDDLPLLIDLFEDEDDDPDLYEYVDVDIDHLEESATAESDLESGDGGGSEPTSNDMFERHPILTGRPFPQFLSNILTIIMLGQPIDATMFTAEINTQPGLQHSP